MKMGKGNKITGKVETILWITLFPPFKKYELYIITKLIAEEIENMNILIIIKELNLLSRKTSVSVLQISPNLQEGEIKRSFLSCETVLENNILRQNYSTHFKY